MPEFLGSSKKDKSDPLNAYKKYREEYGLDTAREDMKEDGVIDNQKKSTEMLLQEYISHRQNYRENFSEEDKNKYFIKLQKLRKAWLDSTKSS